MHLVSPSSEYEDAYLDFAMELRAHGDGRWVEAVQRLGFGEYLLKKQREERGEGLEPDIVPSSVYWLVDDAAKIHAELRLRHYLNERLLIDGGNIGYTVRPSSRRKGLGTELLRRGLVLAQQRGLERVLITCDAENLGSIGVIVANGGREYTMGFSPITERPTRHYWLDCPA